MPQPGDGDLWPTTDDDRPREEASTPVKDAVTREMPVPGERKEPAPGSWFDPPEPDEPSGEREKSHAKPAQQRTQPVSWPVAELEKQVRNPDAEKTAFVRPVPTVPLPTWPNGQNTKSTPSSDEPADSESAPEEQTPAEAAQPDESSATTHPDESTVAEPEANTADQPSAATQPDQPVIAHQPDEATTAGQPDEPGAGTHPAEASVVSQPDEQENAASSVEPEPAEPGRPESAADHTEPDPRESDDSAAEQDGDSPVAEEVAADGSAETVEHPAGVEQQDAADDPVEQQTNVEREGAASDGADQQEESDHSATGEPEGEPADDHTAAGEQESDHPAADEPDGGPADDRVEPGQPEAEQQTDPEQAPDHPADDHTATGEQDTPPDQGEDRPGTGSPGEPEADDRAAAGEQGTGYQAGGGQESDEGTPTDAADHRPGSGHQAVGGQEGTPAGVADDRAEAGEQETGQQAGSGQEGDDEPEADDRAEAGEQESDHPATVEQDNDRDGTTDAETGQRAGDHPTAIGQAGGDGTRTGLKAVVASRESAPHAWPVEQEDAADTTQAISVDEAIASAKPTQQERDEPSADLFQPAEQQPAHPSGWFDPQEDDRPSTRSWPTTDNTLNLATPATAEPPKTDRTHPPQQETTSKAPDSTREDTGTTSHPDTGSTSRPDAGSATRQDSGSTARLDAGSASRQDTGSTARQDTGATSRPDTKSSAKDPATVFLPRPALPPRDRAKTPPQDGPQAPPQDRLRTPSYDRLPAPPQGRPQTPSQDRSDAPPSFIRPGQQADSTTFIPRIPQPTRQPDRQHEWPPPEPPRAAPKRVGPAPEEPPAPRKKKPLLIAAVAVVAVLGLAAGLIFGIPGLAGKLGLTGDDSLAAGPPPAPVNYTPGLHGPDSGAPTPTKEGVAAALAGPISNPALGRITGVVIDPATGETLYERDGSEAITPASTGKILTAAAALLSLDHTEQLVTKVVQGEQPGEVIIVGGGDPTISSLPAGEVSMYPGAPHLDELVEQVRNSGVQVQTVHIDESRYTGPELAPSWLPADIGDGYIAPIVPAMLDGDREDPKTNYSPRTTDPGLKLVNEFASRIGASPAGSIEKKAPANAKVLGEIRSAPMAQLVDNMLDHSDNTLGDILAHEVAIKAGEEPSFDGASKAMLDVLRENGFDVDGVVLNDGSGMSNQNKMSAKVLAQVLAIAAGPDGKDPRTNKLRPILGGLPVAGGSGTLEDRYGQDGAAAAGRGWVRAKTGTLSGVNSLAGIVLDKDNRPLVFAFLTEGTQQNSARPALDVVAAALRGCGCQ